MEPITDKYSNACSFDETSIKRLIENKIATLQRSEISFWLKFIMFITPFFVSFFVWISLLEKRVSITELKQSEITEIKQAIKDVQTEILNLKIQLERINGSK